MLLVETKLEFKEGKGICLIANDFIPKYNKWWQWDDVMDKFISRTAFNHLPSNNREYLIKYAVKDSNGNYLLCGDDARFCNHSDNSNGNGVDNTQHGGLYVNALYTTRDILIGEEITCDYRTMVFDYPKGILDFEVI